MRLAPTGIEHLYGSGLRLDASYHASEGVKALRFVQRWARRLPSLPRQHAGLIRDASGTYEARRVDRLADLAEIFNGPRFSRVYVTTSAHGIPFLSSSDMLKADLSDVKLLSRSRTRKDLLEAIRLERGWTLVSCSGTLGNSVYVRADMEGMAASQHIMRVAPKTHTVPSGYLYAFLSSELGYALFTKGAYGAVVQHIEPRHIADVPVPRLEPAAEQRIHELIERAAALRGEASTELRDAQQAINLEVGFASPR